MSRRGWALFLALGLIWGVPYLLIRVAVADVHPLVVVFGRTAVGGLLLLPVALRRGVLAAVLPRWRMVLAYTLVEICGPWLALGYGEQRLTSSTAGLLVAAVPLVTAVLLVGSGRDRFGLRRWAGLVVGLAGVAGLVGLDVRLDDLPAVGAVMLTVVGYSFGAILADRWLSDLPPLAVTTAMLLTAAALYAPLAVWLWPAHLTAGAAGSVAALGVACTAVAFPVFFALVTEVGPARTTVVTYVNPAVAVALGVLVLGEPLTTGLMVGFPLVIAGSVMATARSGRTSPTKPAAQPAGQEVPVGG